MRLWIIILIVLLPSMAMAGETDIKGFDGFLLLSDIDDYDARDWTQRICEEFQATDNSPVIQYSGYFENTEFFGEHHDVMINIFTHNNKIYRVQYQLYEVLKLSPHDSIIKESSPLFDKFENIGIKVADSAAKKYDDTIFLGTETLGPYQRKTLSYYGESFSSESTLVTVKTCWRDDDDDRMELICDMSTGTVAGSIVTVFDLKLEFTAHDYFARNILPALSKVEDTTISRTDDGVYPALVVAILMCLWPLIFAFVVKSVAKSRGYNPTNGFVGGCFFGPIALIYYHSRPNLEQQKLIAEQEHFRQQEWQQQHMRQLQRIEQAVTGQQVSSQRKDHD